MLLPKRTSRENGTQGTTINDLRDKGERYIDGRTLQEMHTSRKPLGKIQENNTVTNNGEKHQEAGNDGFEH